MPDFSERSLVYLTLGNKFSIIEGKFQHLNLLQYLNLLITETEIIKIELPTRSNFDAPDYQFELDVRCLCLIPNLVYEGKSIPDMEVIGGIKLFTAAGNNCFIVDEAKAHSKFFNEYVCNELSKKHSDFLKQNPKSLLHLDFDDDWNTEDMALKINSEINGDFPSLFSDSYHPNRLGFYSWLFSDGQIIYDVLSEEVVAEAVEMKYPDRDYFSKLIPIKKDD